MADRPSHSEVCRVLNQVLEYPSEERIDAIRKVCGEDLQLRAEVESLTQCRPAAGLLEESLVRLTSVANAVRASKPRFPSVPGFSISDVLGHGSSGIVYLAEQACPRRNVAIKVLRSSLFTQEQNDRMLAEMHILARLEHPCIARLYEVGVLESGPFAHPYFVMEYCRGTPLTRPLEIHDFHRHCVQIIRCIADAIHRAHGQGIVHRDIKPSNVLVQVCRETSEIHVRLIDFGIAKLYRGRPLPVDIHTATDAQVGTRKYMSPERLAGVTNGANPTSDIYSLGVVIHELIESGYWASDHKGRYQRLGEWMTMEDPTRRPQHMADVIHAIDTIEDGQPASSYSLRLSRHRTIWNLRGFALPLLAAICFWLMATQRGPAGDGGHSTIEGASQQVSQTRVRSSGQSIHQLLTSSESRHNWWAIHQLAYSLSQSGRSDEAIAMMEDIESRVQDFLRVDPVSLRRHLMLKGLCFLRTGDRPAAITHYSEALSLIQRDTPFTDQTVYDMTSLAYGFQSCGKLDVAEGLYLELLQHPRFDTISYKHRIRTEQCYAGLLWLTQRYEQAEAYFRIATTRFPATHELSIDEVVQKAVVHSSHGVTLMALGDLSEAEEQLIDAVNIINGSLEPTDIRSARLLRNLCTCYVLSGQYVIARERLGILLSLWADNPSELLTETADAYFLLGSAELGMGLVDTAINHLVNSIELVEDRDDTYSRRIRALAQNALGAALIDSGNREDGVGLLRRSAEVISDEYSATHPWRELAENRAREAGG